MIRVGKNYFTKSLLWNLTHLLPTSTIIAIVIVKMTSRWYSYEPYAFIHTVHSFTSLLLWVRIFYFLRIFESTSYLIRMIIGSFNDMKVFLLILFIVEMSFGEAFLRLSEVSSGEGNFLDNYAMSFVYTFRMSLADNDTDPLKEIT